MQTKSVTLFFLSLLLETQCHEKRLLDSLLKNSSLFVRPVHNQIHPVSVKFGFELIHIISLVEEDQMINLKLWIRMSWINEYLRWDPKKFGDVKSSKLDREKIWTPDIFAKEDLSDEISSGPEKYKTPIIIHYDGRQTWLVPVIIKSSCSINVKYFPFDQQRCHLKFLSWTHDLNEMDIVGDERPMVIEQNYVNSTEWTLLGITSKRETAKYECCPNPFVSITFTLTIDRKPKYYILNVVIPCAIQMIVILFTFFLPPDCGERIAVVITVLLVFAVYLEMVSGSLPKTSNTTPTLSQFYIAAMAETVLALLATCFVLSIHFKGTEKGVRPMPDRVKRFFIDTIAQYVFVKSNLRQHTNESLLALNEDKWENDDVVDVMAPFHGAVKRRRCTMASLQSSVKQLNTQKTKADFDELVSEVRVITKLISDLNRQEEIEEQWQMLGKVLDRLFFILFFILFVSSSLLILLPVYYNEHVHHRMLTGHHLLGEPSRIETGDK